MSKSKRRRAYAPDRRIRASQTGGRMNTMDSAPADPGTKEAPKKRRDLIFTKDTLINQLARLGTDNLMDLDGYVPNRLTTNWTLLDTLYRSDWIANRIVSTPPEDATKNWYKVTASVAPEQLATLEKIERKLHVREDIQEGLRWGRLYGGAAAIMIIKGQEDCLDEPLDLDTIMPGAFRGLIVVDRWNGIYPSESIVTDISDPDLGMPEYYEFILPDSEIGQGVKIHHSRVLRFCGRDLPYIERVKELYWGMSELEHVYNELEKRNVTSANIAQLIFQAHLRVLKIEDLGQNLAMSDEQSQADLYNTLTAQNELMNNFSLQILSKDDDFSTFQYTFSGLSEVYEQFMMDLAGAAEIPATKLFGRAPQGLNSTGEGDLRNYYDTIKQYQEHMLRPVIERLLPVMCVSAWGAVPDDLDFEFNPIRDTNDEERANLIQQAAGAIVEVYGAGLISQRSALMELRKSGRAFDMWTTVSDEMIEEADPSLQPSGGEMGGGGDMEAQMAAMMGMGGGDEEGPGNNPPKPPQGPQRPPQGQPGPSPNPMKPQPKPQMPPMAPKQPQAPQQAMPKRPSPVPQQKDEMIVAQNPKRRTREGVLQKIGKVLQILLRRKGTARNETTGQSIPPTDHGISSGSAQGYQRF